MSQENFARRETKIKALRAGENINNLAEILEKLKTLMNSKTIEIDSLFIPSVFAFHRTMLRNLLLIKISLRIPFSFFLVDFFHLFFLEHFFTIQKVVDNNCCVIQFRMITADYWMH